MIGVVKIRSLKLKDHVSSSHWFRRVDDRVRRFGVIPEPLLDQAGQRRVHHRLVDALFIQQRQPGSRLTHRGGCLDRLAQDLPVALAFRVAVVEVVLLGARRGDLIEGRVGDVIADLAEGGDLRAAVDLDVSDRTAVLGWQEFGQRIASLVHVVVAVEDRKTQLLCHRRTPRYGRAYCARQ